MNAKAEYDPTTQKRLTRRRFLRGMLASVAGVLAACASGEPVRDMGAYRTATPFRAIASPQAPQDETATPAAAGEVSLEQFLQFSSLLTGVDQLDPVLGQVYLNALQSGEGAASNLSRAFSAASSGSGPLPQDLEALSSQGFFDQEGMGELTDQIILLWYTGVYQQDGEDRVATFVDALAWKVLHFTKPLTICAHFGFWSEEPNAQISPDFQYTPAPTQPPEG